MPNFFNVAGKPLSPEALLQFTDTYSRLPVLLTLVPFCTSQHWFRLLVDSWTLCDNIGVHWLKGLSNIFRFSERVDIEQMMDEKERKAHAALPETFQAWRGCYDFNKDGWDDILIIGFPGEQSGWYENPQKGESHWKKHVVLDVTDNESPTFTDLTGDGKPEIVCSSKGSYGYAAPDWNDAAKPWTFHPISSNNKYQRFTHGMGVGGQMAFYLGFNARDMVRGVATSGAVLAAYSSRRAARTSGESSLRRPRRSPQRGHGLSALATAIDTQMSAVIATFVAGLPADVANALTADQLNKAMAYVAMKRAGMA